MKENTKEHALFESSPIPLAILRLALPTVIGQAILVIYNMADTFFIGLTGSDAMVSAVTVCTPAFMFLSAISNLFGVGGSSVISRSLGCRLTDRAQRTSAFAFWGCLLTTMLYALGVWLLLDPFIDALGGSDAAVHAHARGYLIITVVLGGLCTSMSALLAHLVRSEGRSTQSSIGIVLGGLLNIVLDPLFMFVLLSPGSEPLGAALATMLSNVISAMYFAFVMLKNRSNTTLSFLPKHSFIKDIAAEVLCVGLPACLMTLCENISYAVLGNLMAAYGPAAQAGIGVAKKVNMLSHCIARGMAQGVLPLIGYNFASGDHKRMKKAALMAAGIAVGLASVCMGISLIFNRELIGLFIQHGSISVEMGARFLRILCIGGPFSALAYTVISFFQATGHGARSLALALMRKGMLDIPLMFVMRPIIPIYGIVWATPMADIACCIAAIIMYTVFLRSLSLNQKAESEPQPRLTENTRCGISMP